MVQVVRKMPDQVDAPSRDGAFVHGLVLEGAGWDDKAGVLTDSRPKQLTTPLPVVLIRAVPAAKTDSRDLYSCPVYFTERRFREEVFTAQLKTKQQQHGWTHWTTAGVCIFLDVVV